MWTKSTPSKRHLATEPTCAAKQPNTGPSFEEPNCAETKEIVRALCTQLQRLETTPDNKLGASVCNEFQRSVQQLVQYAAMSSQQPLLRVATAMDALLVELPPQPSQFRLRTLRLAVDVLETLIKHPELTPTASCDSAVVVVDETRGSSTSACDALRTVGFHPSSFLDTRAALKHLAANPLDLVVLEMPEDQEPALAFYKELRQLPLHRETQVIFVSEVSGMKSPPAVALDCETQFLTSPNNPLSYLELALKALSRVLNFHMGHVPGATEAPAFVPASSTVNPVQETPQNQHTESLEEQSAAATDLPWLQRFEQSAHRAEVAELEKRLRESAAGCARATADLERERADRRRLEQRVASLASQVPELHRQLKEHLDSEGQHHQRIAALEKQLQEREEALTRASADLEKEKEEHRLAGEQLRETGEIAEKLQESLATFEATKASFQRTQEQLEAQVQTSAKDFSESEARFQKEAAERQRVEEALAAAKRAQQEQATALSKLQSALQVEQAERQRLQSGAIHARYASLDSARTGMTAGNRLRRQVREPLENLLKSTRRMLEEAADDQSKQLVGSILESALLIQSSLQEKDSAGGPVGSSPMPKAA
jgi:response regulator RpfG family c-di-GMP phosphodiesterase